MFYNCCIFRLGKRCSHIAALLFKLQEFKRFETVSTAATSLVCRWTEPAREKVESRQLMDIPFQKPGLTG